MKEKLQILWNQQSERDKRMLSVGAVVVFFYLLYACCYAPLKAHVAAHEQRLEADQRTLMWMKSVRHWAHPNKKPKQKKSASQLLTLISEALPKTPFKGYAYQLQQVGEQDIQLSYESVPYNFFLSWLSNFSEQYQFSVKQFRVDGNEKAGLVKLVVIFEASNV